MKFKAKLNLKFYIVTLLLLGAVIFVWHGIYFLNTNEILMEDNTPMDAKTKSVMSVAMCVIALSWTGSLLTLIRQIIHGQAFVIDKSGIHCTATAIIVFAFIFIVPIKTIPYEAIEKIVEEDLVLTAVIDKSKIKTLPFLKLFVRKKYRFFSGFTLEKQEVVKEEIEKYIQHRD